MEKWQSRIIRNWQNNSVIAKCGDVGGSAKKVGLRIKELDRLYGIKNGGSGFYGNQHSKNEELTNNFTAPQKTEKDIADMMGISRQQLQNYKKLTEMIPELEELLDTGTHADLFNM